VYRKPSAIVRLAINNGLARCLVSQSQLTSLKDFTEELEAQGWSPDSIHQVERGILVSLYGCRAGVYMDQHSDTDAT
jgi:hypothetical protein